MLAYKKKKEHLSRLGSIFGEPGWVMFWVGLEIGAHGVNPQSRGECVNSTQRAPGLNPGIWRCEATALPSL